MRARALPLLLLLPLLAACNDSSPTATPAPRATRTVVTTQSPEPLPTIVGAETQFRTSDGKVGCDLDRAYVLCNVKKASYTPPKKPADCLYTWGRAVEFAVGSKGAFFCGHGEDYTGSARVLPKGQAIKVGLVTCRALSAGVQCQADGHGFRFSPSSYKVF